MSVDTANAGTGIETASQVDAAAAPAPEQAAPSEQQVSEVLPQQTGTEATSEPAQADPLDALKPQSPEEAAKVGQDQPGEAKPAESATEDAPLEITIPEGFQKDEALIKGFLDLAKENGVKQEAAQKLFDMHVAEQQKAATAVQQAIMDQRTRINTEWARQCQTDPEFGGEKYEASKNYVTAAIRRVIADPEEQAEFVKFYGAANLQNSPHMFRFLARVGMMTSEAGPATSDASDAASPKPATLADQLYKGMNLNK